MEGFPNRNTCLIYLKLAAISSARIFTQGLRHLLKRIATFGKRRTAKEFKATEQG